MFAMRQNCSSPGRMSMRGRKSPLIVRRVAPDGSGSSTTTPGRIFRSFSSITRSVIPRSAGNGASTSPTTMPPERPPAIAALVIGCRWG
jgi:hypothetical protein